MILQAIITWYLFGYIFFLLYIMIKYEGTTPMKNDYKIAFFWALFGVLWIIPCLWYTFDDTLKQLKR